MCIGLKAILKHNVKVMCPKPPLGFQLEEAPLTSGVNLFGGNNWFSMVTNEGLDKAVDLVEKEIDHMAQLGIPSEKVVLAGMSQGGATTLYTALNTKYRLLNSF